MGEVHAKGCHEKGVFRHPKNFKMRGGNLESWLKQPEPSDGYDPSIQSLLKFLIYLSSCSGNHKAYRVQETS